jgi:hypothetical protein
VVRTSERTRGYLQRQAVEIRADSTRRDSWEHDSGGVGGAIWISRLG